MTDTPERRSWLRALRLAWFRRPVRIDGVDLRTEDNVIVVAVKRDGEWRDVIAEPWQIRDDDGSIGHSVTAAGIRSFLDRGRC
ncbi:hypothetical protein ACF1BE_19845 [Streptomyces sp. NPDC014991]|uniref:hypothetical protein n=1 Tax=Streptomyces sp. NPDC014991 TaxID=3364935 RepID=UPI0037027632